MQIIVHGNPQQQQVFLLKGIPEGIVVTWYEPGKDNTNIDACFDLLYEEAGHSVFNPADNIPVFVNAVIAGREELRENMIRINAWNGFLERPVIEIAALPAMLANAQAVLDALNWKYEPAPDAPGMIAARVIAMIVNEAYFGLGDEISTKAEIDTAMKLGTNYPYGPFEWSEKIGLGKIYRLLEVLSANNARYAIAPALQKEFAASAHGHHS